MPSRVRMQLQQQQEAGTSPELLCYADYILTTFFSALAEKISRAGHDSRWMDWECRILSWEEVRSVLWAETQRMKLMRERRAAMMALLNGEIDVFETATSSSNSGESQIPDEALMQLNADNLLGLMISPHDFQFYNRLMTVLMEDMGFGSMTEFAWIESLHRQVGVLVRQQRGEQEMEDINATAGKGRDSFEQEGLRKMLGQWMESMKLGVEQIEALEEVERYVVGEAERKRRLVSEKSEVKTTAVVVTVRELDSILV